jgi:hypothetical protein
MLIKGGKDSPSSIHSGNTTQNGSRFIPSEENSTKDKGKNRT